MSLGDFNVRTFAPVLASGSGLDWLICGFVGLITASVCAYRATTRRFGWGPRDT
jgi:hypothetical protein